MDVDTLERDKPDAGLESAKRRQILDGARRVFLADGFDGASMNDVARVAAVSKGTLYVYFDSKEALFEALIREDRKQQAERLVFPGDTNDPREQLASFGRQLITLMTQPELIAQVRIVIAATAKFPNLGRAFYESGPCYGVTRLAGAWRSGGRRSFWNSRMVASQRSSSSTFASPAYSPRACSAPPNRFPPRRSTRMLNRRSRCLCAPMAPTEARNLRRAAHGRVNLPGARPRCRSRRIAGRPWERSVAKLRHPARPGIS